MRGLTAEEYAVMRGCLEADPPLEAISPGTQGSEDDFQLCLRLADMDRLARRAVRAGKWVYETFDVTPAGREAMRLHEALAALEGVS